MKPRIKLAEGRTTEGRTLVLSEQDGAYVISLQGQELMHSRAHASEELLGELGVAHIGRTEGARVLVGGLGLGFTLQRVLAAVGPEAIVEVAELVPAVVEWNRTHLRGLCGAALEDPRVQVRIGDAARMVRAAKAAAYDAILLDLDNGPVALVAAGNASLYSGTGLQAVAKALRVGGRAVFWSARPDPAFAERLARARFTVEAVPAKVHAGARRAAYMIYVATRQAEPVARVAAVEAP